MEKIGLFIGRFQPFHLGHIDAIKQIVEMGYDKIIIGIGSSQEERTLKNPFSYYERKEIIDVSLENMVINYEVYPIPDVGDNKKWAEYILKELPYFDVLFSGNPNVEICFKNQEVRNFDMNVVIKATNIRNSIANNTNAWEKQVHLNAIKIIKLKLDQLKEVLINNKESPQLDVRVVIRNDDKIYLEKKKDSFSLVGDTVLLGEDPLFKLVNLLDEKIEFKICNLKLIDLYSLFQKSDNHKIVLVYELKIDNINIQSNRIYENFFEVEKLERYNVDKLSKKILDIYFK